MIKTISDLGSKDNRTYLSLVAFFGFLGFMLQPTAYTWSEQDMMPFFERVFNPDFLPNDFFTNSAMEKNPRWVFGYFVVAISWVTTLSWYKTLYVLKLLMAISFPVLLFKVLVVLVGKYVNKSQLSWLSPIILIATILMVFVEDFRLYFSVASWKSYSPGLSPMNLSIILILISILLKEAGTKSIWYLGIFFFSFLMHPVMSLFGLLFYFIFILPEIKKQYSEMLKIVILYGIAIFLISYFLGSSAKLGAAEFIEYYVVERHPHHYHVPDFSHPNGNWKHYFILINLLLSIPLFIAFFKKNRKLALLSCASLMSYSGSIAVQYIFIDVYPLKAAAYLGASRFTIFGYWMLIILWSLALAELVSDNRKFDFPNLTRKGFAFVLINMLVIGLFFIDNPKEKYYINRKDFYDFVDSTPKNSTFLSHSVSLNVDLRIVGNRAVFVGQEFPFVESRIKEYNERYVMAYGSQMKETNGKEYYEKLKPDDFVAFSNKYDLDYVIVENEFSGTFAESQPLWKNNRISVYAVNDFR